MAFKLNKDTEMSHQNEVDLLTTAGNLPSTAEQRAIFDFIISQPGNLCVNASAGSSKTTTIVEAIYRACDAGVYQPREILAIAFNKSIADTLSEKMPMGVQAKTMNAVGHAALRSFLGRVNIDMRKTNNVLKEIIPDFYNLRPAERRVLKSMFQTTKMNGVWPSEDEWAEANAYSGFSVPYPSLRKQIANRTGVSDFMDTYIADHDVGETIVEYSELLPLAYALDILHSIRTGDIEFVDQIFLSATLSSVSLPAYKLVVADEAQDFSRIEQFLLSLLVSKVPKGRLVAVGDKAQAIYAFKGADPRAFAALEEKWNATLLPLSTSFRCSHAVVKEAQLLDSRIQPWENALPGRVNRWAEGDWSEKSIPEDVAILCRLNAPLVRLAVQLIKGGRGCQFLGKDIEQGLLSFLDMHSKNLQSMAGLEQHLRMQISEKEEKSPFEADRMRDNWECLQAIFNLYGVEDLSAGEASIIRFFSHGGNTILCSIHKAKGLEFNHVFLLRPDLIPHPKAVESGDFDKLQQEQNMKYVAITRAIDTFTYLEGKEF